MGMALSTGAKILLGIAAVGVGYAVYEATRPEPKPKRKKKPETESSEDEEDIEDAVIFEIRTRQEPPGGWEFRLEENLDDAIEVCRADPQVQSYAQAQICILNHAFPEAAPWGGGTQDWQPWMFDARQAVVLALRDRTLEETGGWGAPGWYFAIWLMFDREFVPCRKAVGRDDVDALTHCLATKMYPPPEYDWPPQADAPAWQQDFWAQLRARVVLALQEPQVSGFTG